MMRLTLVFACSVLVLQLTPRNLIASSDAEGPLSPESLVTSGSVTLNDPGNTRRTFYDGLGRPVRTERDLRQGGLGGMPLDTSNPTNADGMVTSLQEWDGNSRLVARTDDNGNRTYSVFDALDRVTATLFADGTVNNYEYDRDHNLTRMVDAKGTARANSYDRVGRLTRCDVFRAAGVFGTTLQTFEFDGLGRLTRSLDNNDPSTPDDDAVVELRYDSQSRVLEEELNGRVTAADWVADDRTGLRYPNGRRLQYAFDNLDRVKSIANAPASVQAGLIAPLPGGAPIAEFDYVGAGRLLECRLGNGTRRSYVDRTTSRDTGYDALGRLVELDHLGASGQLLAGFSYTYNRTSHVTSERRTHAPSTRSGDRVTYDSLYRIADHYRDVDAAELSAPQPATADEHRAYQLDGAGNWASLTITPQGGSAEVLAQGIGMMNEYTSFGPVQRVHDENGNTTDDGEHLLEYDFLNRLVGARVRASGVRVARYAYDHLSRRTEREVTSSGALDEHVFYFYDGYRVIEEQDPVGTTTAQYVDGLGLDDHVSYSLNADLDASLETTYFHHADAKGWCAAITDAGGGVVERATYDAYGQAQLEDAASAPLPDQSRSAVGNPYLYGGLRLDPETGFLYARHRHYDPKTGRFLQRDPAGLWHDPMARGNAYLYAALSPWTYGDAMGTTAVPMQTLFTLMDAAWSARDLIGGKLGQVADVVGHFLWGVIQGGGIAWNDLSAAMGVLWGHPMDALDGMLRGAIDEVWNVLLASTGELQGMAQRAMPEISYLITNWDRLDTNDRARLVGKAMARHGAQLLGGGLAAMAAKKLAKKLAQKLLSNPPNAPAPHALANWVKPAGWRLPKNGTWSGTPGHSVFTPSDARSLGLHPDDTITFREGYPDFGPYSARNYRVTELIGDHDLDRPLINAHIARQEGFWNSDGTPNGAAVQRWLDAQNLTPHHAGGSAVQLIDRDLHMGVRHMGGAYALRNGG